MALTDAQERERRQNRHADEYELEAKALRMISVDSEGNLASNSGESVSTDEASDFTAHVSHFGVLKAGTTIPVVKGNFAGSSLNEAIWYSITENGGNATVSQGVAELATSTDAAGSIKLHSRVNGRFEAGQITVYQSGVYAGVGVANNVRCWGVMDKAEQNGLYFKWNGTTFQVVAMAGGTENAVDSADFNGEADWEPGASNNTYRIEYSAGRALFYRASGGKKMLLHSMVDTQYPVVEDLDLGLYYENTNTGNTTDVTFRLRGASSSVWGQLQRFNAGGSLLTSDFTTEVALGVVANYEIGTKFGRNPDIDTGTTPEDMYAGGGTYTGFNATANEDIEVLSSDNDDRGSVLSTGTSTAGTELTLTDSTATFVTDGVTAGDLLINDSRAAHGIVTAVTETQITVFRMEGGKPYTIFNGSGDTYRVATSIDTGAAVVVLEQLKNNLFVPSPAKYVVLNGTTGVTVTGDFIRCTRARIIIAGSTGNNEGTITVRQATTTANIFAQLPAGFGQTTIGCYTVDAGKTFLLKRVRVSISRSNGSAGSATITLRARRFGEVFRAIRAFEIQTGAPTEFLQQGADILPEGTDIKFTIDDVSDSNTVAEAAFEYLSVVEE